jgi:large subunit ribosomal protein L9
VRVKDRGERGSEHTEAVSMKVILLEDVHGIGEAGSVEDVADGYARNYLIPRKLAVLATSGGVKNLDHHRREIRRRQAREASSATAVAERLGEITLRLESKAGEAGKLYGSITTSEIAEELAQQHELHVDRRAITLPYPIKTLGPHEAHVKLHKDVEATLKIEVEALAGEGEVEAEAEAQAEG